MHQYHKSEIAVMLNEKKNNNNKTNHFETLTCIIAHFKKRCFIKGTVDDNKNSPSWNAEDGENLFFAITSTPTIKADRQDKGFTRTIETF